MKTQLLFFEILSERLGRGSRFAAAVAAGWIGLGLPAQAAVFTQVQSDKSSIAFVYQQMGVTMDGQFKRFKSSLVFDTAKPAAAKATIEVDLASIDTGTDADKEVGAKTWFNTQSFPTARFVSGAVKPLGGNRYEIAGNLTIKGQTKAVTVPATFATQGKAGVFEGSFTIRRGDFSIGEGAWAKFDVVGNDVVVKFRITAASGS